MSSAPSRLMLRHNRVVARRTALRHASTTSEATQAVSKTAEKGKETASNMTSKASSGLSRVTSSAGSVMGGASQGVSNTVNRLGGRLGSLINFVQCAFLCPYCTQTFQQAQLIPSRGPLAYIHQFRPWMPPRFLMVLSLSLQTLR